MSDLLDIHDDDAMRRLLIAAALLMIAIPFIQVGAQIWPLRPSDIRWRFDAAANLTSVLLMPFLGMSLLRLVGKAMESRGLSLTVTILSALMTAGLAASVVVFALDAIQLKTIVTSQMLAAFKVTSVRVGVIAILFAIAYLMLALSGREKRTRRVSSSRRSRTASYDDDDEDDEDEDYAPRSSRRSRAGLLT
jgi:hypothetical protein